MEVSSSFLGRRGVSLMFLPCARKVSASSVVGDVGREWFMYFVGMSVFLLFKGLDVKLWSLWVGLLMEVVFVLDVES